MRVEWEDGLDEGGLELGRLETGGSVASASMVAHTSVGMGFPHEAQNLVACATSEPHESHFCIRVPTNEQLDILPRTKTAA